MRGPDSRGSKNRLGHSRPSSQPSGHKEVEGGMNSRETHSSCTSNCMTKGNKERTRNITEYMLFYFFRMVKFSQIMASTLRSYFCGFCWKTGFCLVKRSDLVTCSTVKWKYQICADSIGEASDTWILNMPKKGNGNTIEKVHLNKSSESMRKTPAVMVTDSLKSLALCHEKT